LYTPAGSNFLKSRVHGYGRLGDECLIIENFNLIVKLENQGVNRIAFLRGFEEAILVDRFS
jgi:hypothetical protein